MATLQHLPREVIERIVSYLDTPSLAHLSETSTDLRCAVREEYEKRKLVRVTGDAFRTAADYAKELQKYIENHTTQPVPPEALAAMPEIENFGVYRRGMHREEFSFRVDRWHVSGLLMHWTAPTRMYPGLVITVDVERRKVSAYYGPPRNQEFVASLAAMIAMPAAMIAMTPAMPAAMA